MPKEVVRNFSRAVSPDGPALVTDLLQAEVHWSRDMYVQVATVRRPKVPKAGDTAALTAEDEGFFVELDRAGINHLIRILRKARDQAYGADA